MTLGHLIHQKSYEKIEYAIRRHSITFVPYLFLFLVLLAIPFVIQWLILNSALAVLIENPTYYVVMILMASIYYLYSIVFFYTHFVSFHLDLWIITNDRLIDIEQKTLFARTMSELDLYQIQDATSEVHGILPTLFNYGNIRVQTAGASSGFMFQNVPRPHKLRQTILDLAAEDKKFHETHSSPATDTTRLSS